MSQSSPSSSSPPSPNLFSLLKSAFCTLLDLAPPLLSPPPTSVSHISSSSPSSSSAAVIPLGPSADDSSQRSCVDFLRRLLGAAGATEMRINSLPVRSLCMEEGRQLAYGQDTCAICLDGYQQDNRVRVLGCKHVFHAGCIDPWLRRGRPTCPLCQTVCC